MKPSVQISLLAILLMPWIMAGSLPLTRSDAFVSSNTLPPPDPISPGTYGGNIHIKLIYVTQSPNEQQMQQAIWDGSFTFSMVFSRKGLSSIDLTPYDIFTINWWVDDKGSPNAHEWCDTPGTFQTAEELTQGFPEHNNAGAVPFQFDPDQMVAIKAKENRRVAVITFPFYFSQPASLVSYTSKGGCGAGAEGSEMSWDFDPAGSTTGMIKSMRIIITTVGKNFLFGTCKFSMWEEAQNRPSSDYASECSWKALRLMQLQPSWRKSK
jgi:hypothetical protein